MSTLNQDVIAFVEKSGEAMRQADAYIAANEAELAKVATITPQVATALQQAGLIRPTQYAAAVTKLASHQGALEVVQNLLAELSEVKQANVQTLAATGVSQGSPVKQANHSSSVRLEKYSNFAGAPRGYGEESVADREFAEAILGRR